MAQIEHFQKRPKFQIFKIQIQIKFKSRASNSNQIQIQNFKSNQIQISKIFDLI